MTLPKFTAYAFMVYAACSLTAMAPMNLGFSVVLFACILNAFRSNREKINFSDSLEFKRYRFWAFTLLITCWGSLIVTRFFPYAYACHDPEVTLHGFVKIWYLLIPALLLFAFESANFTLNKVIKPWWITTLVLLAVAIIQFFTGWPKAQQIPHMENFHAILFFGHHLSTASIIIFPTFTALAVAFGYFTRKNKNEDYPLSPKLASLVGISGFLILFLSYARTAWIAILLGVAILLQKYLGKHLNRQQWIAGLMGILLALGIFSQSSLVKERIIKNYGVSDRTELWKANIDFFMHRPLTGIGWLKTQEMSEFYFKQIDPENYQHRFWGHAHSNFFEMLGGTGLLGLLAFLGWSIFTVRFAYQVSKKLSASGNFFYADFAFGLFIALILLHFNGLTNVTFWEGKVMHQQMLAVGMLLILNRRSNSNA